MNVCIPAINFDISAVIPVCSGVCYAPSSDVWSLRHLQTSWHSSCYLPSVKTGLNAIDLTDRCLAETQVGKLHDYWSPVLGLSTQRRPWWLSQAWRHHKHSCWDCQVCLWNPVLHCDAYSVYFAVGVSALTLLVWQEERHLGGRKSHASNLHMFYFRGPVWDPV